MQLRVFGPCLFGLLLFCSNVAFAQFTVSGELKYSDGSVPKNCALKLLKFFDESESANDSAFLQQLEGQLVHHDSFLSAKDQEMFIENIRAGGFTAAISWALPNSRAAKVGQRLLGKNQAKEVKEAIQGEIASLWISNRLPDSWKRKGKRSSSWVNLFGERVKPSLADFTISREKFEKIVHPFVVQTVAIDNSGLFELVIDNEGQYALFGSWVADSNNPPWYSELNVQQKHTAVKILIVPQHTFNTQNEDVDKSHSPGAQPRRSRVFLSDN